MTSKIWIPTWRLKDKTPLFGPFTSKPSGNSVEFVIEGKSYWVESPVTEFSSDQKKEVEEWIRSKMGISMGKKE